MGKRETKCFSFIYLCVCTLTLINKVKSFGGLWSNCCELYGDLVPWTQRERLTWTKSNNPVKIHSSIHPFPSQFKLSVYSLFPPYQSEIQRETTAVCSVDWDHHKSPPHHSETFGTTQTDQRELQTEQNRERKRVGIRYRDELTLEWWLIVLLYCPLGLTFLWLY